MASYRRQQEYVGAVQQRGPIRDPTAELVPILAKASGEGANESAAAAAAPI